MKGFTNTYFVIFVSSLSTVHSTYPPAQETSIDLGISTCRWWGTLKKACNVSGLKAKKVPEECTTLLYEGLRIDLENQVQDTLGKNVLDKLLATKKNVMMYIGHWDGPEWITALNVSADQAANDSATVMENVDIFVENHKGVKGFIFINFGENGLRPFTANVAIYVNAMRAKFPGMAIGISISSSANVFKAGDLKSHWLDLTKYPALFDFYIVNLIDINNCTCEFVETGVFPLTGNGYTLDTYKNYLVDAGIQTSKIYYDIQTSGTLKDLTEDQCHNLYYYICCQQIKSDNENLCADTLQSYYDKGKYVKANGNGFIVTIDIDDFAGTCQCDQKFPIFYAVLNGFNGQSPPTPCPLFDRC